MADASGVTDAPGLLARGPWSVDDVEAVWRSDPYEPEQSESDAADTLLAGLRDRGSPSHDGLAAQLVDFSTEEGKLRLELQPGRWALRLVRATAARSVSALCLVRAADGRWLAGRRAEWLASWPGRWALGAGGAVEVDENPAATLERELGEEWSVAPERLTVEALVQDPETPGGMVLLVGVAWLADGAGVTPDAEHDTYTWWPADVSEWPPEADAPLRRIGELLQDAGR